MPAPAFVVSHRRTGVAALNVVTAALDVDARTEGTDVGDLYGSWRQQLVRGTELVRQREAARAERTRGGRS